MSCGGREDEVDGGLCARGTVAPPEVALKLHLAKAVFYNRYNLGASPRDVEGGTRDEGGQASARDTPRVRCFSTSLVQAPTGPLARVTKNGFGRRFFGTAEGRGREPETPMVVAGAEMRLRGACARVPPRHPRSGPQVTLSKGSLL